MISRFFVLLLSAGLSSPIFAAENGPPASTVFPEPPKMVCKREPVTGTHMKKKVCRTEQQIAEEQADSRKQLRQLQDFQNSAYQHRISVQGSSP